MKRADIKRRPLADTTLAGLEPESKEYRELDGNGLYFRVKPDGGKSWQLRYKRPAGNWAWMGLGGYPEVSGALARDKAADLRKVVSSGADPLEQKRSAKAAIDAAKTRTFRAAAEAWLKAKEEKGLAPSTLQKIRTCLDVVLIPHQARYVEACDFEFELFCLDAPLKVHLDLPAAPKPVGRSSDLRMETPMPAGLRFWPFCNTTA